MSYLRLAGATKAHKANGTQSWCVACGLGVARWDEQPCYYFPETVRSNCPQIKEPIRNKAECGISEHDTFSITFLGPTGNHTGCKLCRGQGWIPNEDSWVWLEWLFRNQWRYEASFMDDTWWLEILDNENQVVGWAERQPTLEAALLAAIEQTVVNDAGTLMEVA